MDKKRISERTEAFIALGLMCAFLFAISFIFCAWNVSLKDQIKSNSDTIANLQSTIDSKEKDINDLQEKLDEQSKTIIDLQNALDKSKASENLQNERIDKLTQENQQLEKECEAIQQLMEEINQIPERYKETFFKTSEITFAATLFNQDIRVLKIDTKANKIIDILTDTELEMKGVHNFIEGSYGYEFTMEEFLKGDTAIEINGMHYSVIGIPSILETKAFEGNVSLYDICETLTVLRAEKTGQFILETIY